MGGLLGARFCLQDDSCGDEGGTKVGATLQGQVGVRVHKYLEVGGVLGLAMHGIDTDGDEDIEKARTTSVNLLAYLNVYPWSKGIWHPYIGVGVGFNQDRSRFTYSDDKFQDWTNRGLIRASLGLDIMVTEKLSVGPRLDYDLQFIGKVCSESSDSKKDCVSFSDIDDDGFDWPRWITFGAALKGHFGAKKW